MHMDKQRRTEITSAARQIGAYARLRQIDKALAATRRHRALMALAAVDGCAVVGIDRTDHESLRAAVAALSAREEEGVTTPP